MIKIRMTGLVAIFFLLFLTYAESKYVIEFTRKVKRVQDPYIFTVVFNEYYTETDHYVAPSFKKALTWINLKGRYETFRHTFTGIEKIDPIHGFEFVALYNCSSEPIKLIHKKIGEEKTIVQVDEERTVPVMEWVF